MIVNSAGKPLAGKLTIKAASAQAPESNFHNPLKTGLKISNSSSAISPQTTKAPAESMAAPDPKTHVSERFAEKMRERCRLEMEKRPLAEQNFEHAEILANSLLSTAQEIEKQYGKEQANSFMSQMLSATDQKVDENLLAAAVNTFFNTVKTEALTAQQKKGFSGVLNKGCESLAPPVDEASPKSDTKETEAKDSAATPGNYGLAYGMNLFFNTATETESKDFDLDYNWVTVSNEPIDLTRANNVTAGEFTKSDESEGLAEYLLNQAGSQEASDYIKNLPSGSNFMEAIATSVAIVAEEKGQGAAREYVAYLNQNLKNPIDDSLSEVSFHGWRLSGDPKNPPREALEAPTELWFSDSEIQRKEHQGLINKFTDKETGVGIYKTLDLNELYAAYIQGRETGKERVTNGLNQPAGNLVDTVA